MKKIVHTAGVAETEELASEIGSRLRGGEVFELISDLGGGKTAFVRGLARGMGSPDHVSSPTFTIGKVYKSAKLALHHFDFYRLHDPGLMVHELGDIVGSADMVIAVEWGAIVDGVLPKQRVVVNISATSENAREITLTYPKKFGYIMESK